MKMLLLLALILGFNFNTSAEEHGMTNISGTNVELKSFDHAIAGALNGFLIFGNIDEEKGQSTLTIKKDGVISHATFERQADKSFGGRIIIDGIETKSDVAITFIKLNRDQNIFTYKINNDLVDIKITADDFRNNHFINPKYSTTLKGLPFEFKMENGQACYNMSAHLIAMMIGSASL